MLIRARSLRGASAKTIASAVALTLVAVALSPVILATSAAAANVTVSGTVFNDYNHDGDQDGGEPGVSGVTVLAYDSTGASWSGTTNGSGAYSINAPTAATTDLRIEIVVPDGYEDSRTGSASSHSFSTVRFTTGNTSGVNFGIEQPGDYCQNDPNLVTTVFCVGNGGHTSSTSSQTVYQAPYDSDPRTGAGLMSTTGSVNAVAWDPVNEYVYLASYVKRHVGLIDARGADAIFRMNPATNTTAHWFDLADIGIDVGQAGVPNNATRGITNASLLSTDATVFAQVGKRGIGDIDTNGSDTLFVTNLFNRTVHSIPIPADGSAPTTQTSLGVPSTGITCTNGTARPFGLGYNDGVLYAGIVCDAATGTTANLDAYVMRHVSGTTWAQVGPRIDLDYDKGTVYNTINSSSSASINKWHVWSDTFTAAWDSGVNSGATGAASFIVRPTPMLSDIEFDDDGSLVLGFRDRTADMIGADNYPPNAVTGIGATDLIFAMAGGDILRMCLVSGSYVLQGASGCGLNATNGQGLNNNLTSGYGEYYAGDSSGPHAEISNGHLAIAPNTDETLMSAFNADDNFNSGGIRGLDSSTGAFLADISANYYTAERPATGQPRFGKANGMGDLELLCDAAPLQIGNRVWNDLDNDGVQDAGEAGIDGVTVQLLNSSNTVVGTAVTSGGGQYYFRTGLAEAAGGNGDNVGGGLALREDFTIRIGTAANYQSGGPLHGRMLTTANTALGSPAYTGQSDYLDSDPTAGVGAIGVDWFPTIPVTAASTLPGVNDHTYDAGFFTPLARDLALRKIPVSATGPDEGPPLAPGTVTFEIQIHNQSAASGAVNGILVTDYIDTDFFDALTAAPAAGTTGGDHALPYTWSISGGDASATTPQVTITGSLPAGDYVTVPITLAIAADAPLTGLYNYAEISRFDTDGNAANGDSTTGHVYDTDSIPDATFGNDQREDDEIDEAAWTNTGSSSTGPAGGQDEDDEDVAFVPLWDLALIKERASGQDSHITSGVPATATFTITVKNQGETTAYDIRVQDYLGAGFAGFGTQTSPQSSGGRTITHLGLGQFSIDQLDAGESVSFDVVTSITTATDSVLVNTAEITQFDDDADAGNGISDWVFDYDSIANTDPNDDALSPDGAVFDIDSHNEIDNPPVNGFNPDDEDDHDSEGVTFGFMRLGSTVYIDANADQVGEFGEGVEGVLVVLLQWDGDSFEPVDSTVTDADGDYFFAELFPGVYRVGIPSDQSGATEPAALDGYTPVPGSIANPEDENFDNDGDAEAGYLSISDPVTLTYGAEAGDNAADTTRADAAVGSYADENSQLNVDFVFEALLYEIGNLVWLDADDDGIAELGETGIDGVTVELYQDNGAGGGIAGDGMLHIDERVATTTTANGYYTFTDLPAGEYIVHIPSQAGLDGYGSSGAYAAPPGSQPEPDADNDVDNDNNGVVDDDNGGWTAGIVSLGEGTGAEEPTGEDDGIVAGPGVTPAPSTQNNRANATVDFGFAPRVRLGNQVWRDESDADPGTVETTDNNGLFDIGEAGIGGVTVDLFLDVDDDGVFEPGGDDGSAIATTATDTEGNYWFSEVLPDRPYFIALRNVPGGEFGTPRSSSYQSAAVGDSDNDDDGGEGLGVYVTHSRAFAPAAGSLPTGEADTVELDADTLAEPEADREAGSAYPDDHSNLRIDFGLVEVPLYRIGNLVWLDADNDAFADDDEDPIEGVWVRLLDSDGDVVGDTVTDAAGRYSFENLAAGDYRVVIPQDQTTGAPIGTDPTALAGLASSAPGGVDVGPDPDVDTDDNDDNGVLVAGVWRTDLVTLGGGFTSSFDTEPENEVDFQTGTDDDPDPGEIGSYPDGRSNYTVDFGFHPLLRVGDTVWLDDGGSPYDSADEDNGVYDATESPIEDVEVRMYLDDGDGVFEPGADDTLADSQDTDGDGEYFFWGFEPGSYWLAIPDGQAELDGLRSSTGQSADGVGTNDLDHGAPETGFSAVSPLIALAPGGLSYGDAADEANADTKTGQAVRDENSNLVVDFGFSPEPDYRIGNLVWLDADNDGVADLGEVGIPGVTVQLFADVDDDGLLTGADGPALATQVTGPGGVYEFSGLEPGDYLVHIPEAAPLVGRLSSGAPDATPDNDEDNDNNGVPDGVNGGWTSGPLTLGEGDDHSEPEGEEDGTTGDPAEDGAVRDDRSNLTVDFGFWDGLRLGNTVWRDESDWSLATTAATDNNGVIDPVEAVMPDVTVALFRDGGDGVFDAGEGAGDDTLVGTTDTDAEGNYWFSALEPGDYFVAIEALDPTDYPEAMKSSDVDHADTDGTDTPVDNLADDNNDNGAPEADGAGNGYLAVSNLVTLTSPSATAPLGEADALPSADGPAEDEADDETGVPTPDAFSDLTIDFGLILVPLYRVGNLVWEDLDRDGVAEVGEPGIQGVLVQLLDDSDTVIAEAVTDADGRYDFADLAAGDYRVRIPGDQTPELGPQAGILAAALDNLVSTTDGGAPGVDNDDNGVVAGADWQSAVITLGASSAPYGTEPTDETARDDDATDDDSGWANGTDAHSDFTVDFGFYPGLRLGDTVWFDDGFNGTDYTFANENNGVYDAGELPAGGVDVQLFMDDGDGVFEPGGDDGGPVATDTTDGDGEYFFTGLDENIEYWVAIPDSETSLGGPLAGFASSAGQSPDGLGTNDLDHGAPETGFAAVSPLIVLDRGGMAYGDAADEANADAKTGIALIDGHSNLVVDFGFAPVPVYRIGNLVWLDDDNGLAELGETGIDLVTVHLYTDDGDGVFEPGGDDGAPATTTTDSDGRYGFDDLPAGEYWVHIPEQSALEGLASSLVRQTDADNDVDNDNNAIEDVDNGGWTAGLVSLGEGDDHSEPEGEEDGTTGDSAEDGAVRDDRSNQTVDFGFSPRVRLGNQVWRDESDGDPATEAATDNNGVFDAGSGEVGITGVDVELWHDTDGDGFQGGADDVLLDTVPTDGEGNYLFTGLLPRDGYYVAIETVGAPFSDARSSAGQSASPSAGDNDDDGAPTAGYLSVSDEIDLSGAQPTGESDAVPAEDAEAEANALGDDYPDDRSNLRVDFGFVEVPLYRLGNLVWLDADNDGIAEDGEPGIEGVLVQLLDDADTVIAETVTDADGRYFFEDLAAGEYRVRVPSDQTEDLGGGLTITAGALDNLASSTTDAATPDDDADNDDNGLGGADWTTGTVTLGAGPDDAVGTEPTDETVRDDDSADDDSGWAGGPDNRSNTTVDLGFYELLRLGNVVWLDDGAGDPSDEDNGFFDAGESPIDGVAVHLFADDGDGVFEPGGDDGAALATDTTDGDGQYYFTGLTEGSYWVAIPGSQAPLSSLRSSTGQAPSDALDGYDQGEPEAGYASVSNVVLLDAGAMPTTDSADEATADAKTGVTVADASSKLTIDFGFSPVPEYALGNLVWEDWDNDGLADAGEPGIAGIEVELWRDVDADGDFEPGGDDAAGFVADDTTDADGRYLFEGLEDGEYFVHVPDGQSEIDGWYIGGGHLGGVPVEDADGDVDNDNNAVADDLNGGFTSGQVSLGEGDDHSEPEGEADGTTGDSAEDPVSVRDDRSNQTVDFGFWRGLRLGNQVWLDEGADDNQNNGLYDADEAFINGVTVELWLDGGDGVFDAGEPGGDDTHVASATTSTNGRYLFEGLPEGSYFAAVPSVPGGGVQSSTNPSPTGLAEDGEDDGSPTGAYLSVSPLYTLSVGGAPTGEVDGPGATGGDAEANANGLTGFYPDDSSYLTVDFGFIDVPLYRIGNLVWFDGDNDGVAEDGEDGIEGVLVQLFDDSDALVAEAVTDAFGKYAFTNLVEGSYTVSIPVDQTPVDNALLPLITAGALDEFHASTVYTADADGDVDNDNNGALDVDAWVAQPVVLGPDAPGDDPDVEPTDEQLRADDSLDDDAGQVYDAGPPVQARIDDDRSNFSVDFGFYSLSLGNLVFTDMDADGVYEPADGDVGVDGVLVELWEGGVKVDEATTAGGGLYLFTGLEHGATYTVLLPASNFAVGGPLEGWTSSPGSAGDPDVVTTDGLDRGNDPASAYGEVSSDPVTVFAADEPTDDGQGDNPDNDTVRPDDSENLVVDFGFYQLELGGNVFFDPDNDGLDDSDGNFEDVVLRLFHGDGTPFLRADGTQASTTTDADGDYLFTGLPTGDYIVEVVEENFDSGEPLFALGSSDGNDVAGLAPDPDNDVSGEDNGNPYGGSLFDGHPVRSAPVTLAPASEPDDDTDPSAGTPDENSNRSVDFGFWTVQDGLELGNQLWFDFDEDGVYDVGAEAPVPVGVVVQLFDATTDTLLRTTFTDGNGQYLFDNLPAGSYYIVLPAINFEEGGPLHGYVPTTGPGASTDADNRLDSDSNALPGTVGSARSATVTFYAEMPIDEIDPAVTVENRLSNLSLDIGLIVGVLSETGADAERLVDYAMALLLGGSFLLLLARRVRREDA